MVGFEDSVNMAEETKDPARIFPRVHAHRPGRSPGVDLRAGRDLGDHAGLARTARRGGTPLLEVVQAGAPGFPLEVFAFITMFAVANSRADQHADGQPAAATAWRTSRSCRRCSAECIRRGVTPYVAILFTTLLAFGLITVAARSRALGGTTAFLLLCVFAVVNVAVLVLRRDRVDHKHFRTPTLLPVLGALTCAFLVGPWTGRDTVQYTIAGVLIGVGVLLWLVTVLINRATGVKAAAPTLETVGASGPVNSI